MDLGLSWGLIISLFRPTYFGILGQDLDRKERERKTDTETERDRDRLGKKNNRVLGKPCDSTYPLYLPELCNIPNAINDVVLCIPFIVSYCT